MNDLGLLKPVCLFEQFFDENLRLSNVPRDKFARFSCCAGVISTAAGSALVSVGATRVICGVKVRVLPSPLEETASPFICTIEHMGLAQRGQRINAPPTKELQSLTVQLEWLLTSTVVPNARNQLLIHSEGDTAIPPTGAYLLHIDVAIILDDGCLFDACLAAALAALQTASWPRLVAVPSPQTVNSAPSSNKTEFKVTNSGENVKLVLCEYPVALTFAIVPCTQINASHEIICQPSRSEELLWDTDASICRLVVDSCGRVIDFSMMGGFASGLWQYLEANDHEGTGTEIIQQIISRAIAYAPLVCQQINAMDAD